MDLSQLKRLAGERAVDYVQSGMAVGLGSGSTVFYAIQRLAERVRAGLEVRCIPTSLVTERLARSLGLRLLDFSEVAELDLVIDGADEVDPNCNLVKGGGGALLREKVVAAAARRVVILVDETKLVGRLGAFPLPVEVLPFGWQVTLRRLERLGCRATLRERGGEPFLTDNGNFIIDCHFGEISAPAELEREIDLIPGVVESGLFLNLADLVLVGRREGIVEEITCRARPSPQRLPA
ncbi:MAG: ribose-5-phosphate isomerase RpiA [Candidatus Acetothermia bacterium]|nr:ribose-5-phosphate isomerase RpiA [Candidatus Acetothermia bacterium]MDH7504580.1 ribose-5-phosphate isomerase RpiA [Candidatus Acetothermia bacterium]